MNKVLSPAAAASVAARVYDIRKTEEFKSAFHIDFNRNFKLTNSQIKGISGGIINQLFNRQTGFALTAEGRAGVFKKHHIIAIRGTDSGADWLSNFNVGLTNGPNNMAVHAGFHKVFRSMRPAFEQYVNEHKPRCIHCVGHSLGGALAQLTALWARERGIPAKLYTFGSPRVITEHNVPKAAANITNYRIIHGADPVPYVPTWPFAHTAGEYQLAMHDSARLNGAAHLMENEAPGYINTAGSYKDFSGMAGSFKPLGAERVVLDYDNRHQANFSQRWQRRIADALITFLKAGGRYTIVAASVGLTFYDVLARNLEEIILASRSAAEQLKGILGHILVMVGRGWEKVKEMTAKYIRWVIELMIKALYKTAKSAIDSVF